MTFDDLPPDWPTRSLVDRVLVEDVVDLMVGVADRQQGAFVLLVCDADVRLVQPIAIGPLDGPCDPAVVQNAIDVICEVFGPDLGAGTLIAAVARPGSLHPTEDDRAWLRALLGSVDGTGWVLQSAHVVNLHGSARFDSAA